MEVNLNSRKISKNLCPWTDEALYHPSHTKTWNKYERKVLKKSKNVAYNYFLSEKKLFCLPRPLPPLFFKSYKYLRLKWNRSLHIWSSLYAKCSDLYAKFSLIINNWHSKLVYYYLVPNSRICCDKYFFYCSIHVR